MNFFIFCLFTRKPLNFLFASKFGPFKLFLIPSPSSSSFSSPSSLPSVCLFFNNLGSYTKYILIPTKHYKALSESHSPIRNNNKIISELIKTKLLFSQVFRLSIFNKGYFYIFFFFCFSKTWKVHTNGEESWTSQCFLFSDFASHGNY